MERVAATLVDAQRPDFVSITGALELLAREGRSPAGMRDLAKQILARVASRESGRELRSDADLIGWVASLPEPEVLLRLLLAVPDGQPSDELDAALLLLVARYSWKKLAASPKRVPFQDAPVECLDKVLFSTWKKTRTRQEGAWLYHPRKPSISNLIIPRFASDMLQASLLLKQHALEGAIACDLNIELKAGGRRKSLDFALGIPEERLGPGDSSDPLRKARLREPLVTLEVKACMTAHRQATPRLIDELRSSLDVVKSSSRRAIPVAITVVNVSSQFTNPLRLPGPNRHKRYDIERLFRRLIERVHLDRGSGQENAYGALGIVVVDTDNEHRIIEADRMRFVPETHTYERAIGRTAALYEALELL